MSDTIGQAETDGEIASCFETMRELRPHLVAESFVERIREQMAGGYRLARLEAEGKVRAVAGYRILQNLVWGRFMYVDDLVTAADSRSKGYGEALFSWLVEQAREEGCEQFHLDSGVQRFDAHRFYLARRMAIVAHHFELKLR